MEYVEFIANLCTIGGFLAGGGWFLWKQFSGGFRQYKKPDSERGASTCDTQKKPR